MSTNANHKCPAFKLLRCFYYFFDTKIGGTPFLCGEKQKKGGDFLEPETMAPGIFFQVFFGFIEFQVHGGVLDGKTPLMGQCFHHHEHI